MALKERGRLNISKDLLAYFHSGKVTLEMFMARDLELGRKEWSHFRDRVIAEWVADKPGTRPWAFWEYDSPRHPTKFIPINLDEVEMVERNYIRFGITHRPGPALFPEPPFLFESEAAYLKRRKLLLKGEIRRIKPEDFKSKETYPYFKPDRFGQYSRVYDYEAIKAKTRERMKTGGSVDIRTYGLPESSHKKRFRIYTDEFIGRYYMA
jgi:hypothetical protein